MKTKHGIIASKYETQGEFELLVTSFWESIFRQFSSATFLRL